MGFAIVTGGAKGIGRAIATELASRRFDLLLVSLPGEDLHHVAAQIQSDTGRKVLALEMNLAVPEAPEELHRYVSDLQIEVEVLVNNAGFGTMDHLLNDPWHIHQSGIMVNVHAVVSLTHLFLEDMVERRKGRILTLGSTAGLMPVPYKTTYSAAKSFIHTFSQALALELEGSGVTVTCVCPGGTYTNPAAYDRIHRAGMISRWAATTPEEVAKEGIDALLRGKRFVIPGTLNKIITKVGLLLPFHWYTKRLGASMLPDKSREK